MSENSKKPLPADDIDLLSLLERSLAFFIRYKWVYTTAIVLGLAFGFYKYKSLPKIYQSRLIVQSFFLSNQNQIEIVSRWNELLKKGEYDQLASQLQCSPALLHHLKAIKADEIQKVFTPTSPHGFYIEVKVTDNAVLDSLQQGILDGFENNEYASQKLATKRANLEILISKTAEEIQKLDSTKKLVEDMISGKSRTASSFIIDIASINKQLVELNEKYLYYKDELKFAKSVQVLESFGKFRQPIGPNLIPWLIIGLLVFLSIAYVGTLLHSLAGRLKMRARNG